MASQTPDIGPAFIAVTSDLMTQHNLGGLVDLVFVRVGNEVMASALGKLQLALSSTQKSLAALTDLQNLHNQISIGDKSAISNMFNFTAQTQIISATKNYSVTTTGAFVPQPVTSNTTTTGLFGIPQNTTYATTKLLPPTKMVTSLFTKLIDGSNYVSGYNLIASAYYGNPIDPYWSVTVPGAQKDSVVPITADTSANMTPAMRSAYNYFKAQLAASKSSISGLIHTLSAITPLKKDKDGIEIPFPAGLDETALLAKLKKVYNSIPGANGSFASTKAWALDGYTNHGTNSIMAAGLLQQDIQGAITAGQSLNSSQNASVRNYMFIFEQYYQAASSIMSSLNQTLLGMSRKISGN